MLRVAICEERDADEDTGLQRIGKYIWGTIGMHQCMVVHSEWRNKLSPDVDAIIQVCIVHCSLVLLEH